MLIGMGGGVAMVFSGGGAPAAYFGAGVVRAVEEAGLEPTLFSGVSSGAFNAAALAVGKDADALAELWRAVRWRDVARWRTDLQRLPNMRNLLRGSPHLLDWLLRSVGWTSLLDNSPARDTLIRHLGGPELPIADGRTLVISSVDIATGDVVQFSNAAPRRPGRITQCVDLSVDHVLASAAVPIAFPPVVVDGRSLVDAGTVANTPLRPVMDYEPDAVIVVSGGGGARPAPAPSSLGETIGLLVDNLAHFALHADFDHAATVNALAREAPATTDRRYVPMVLVEPVKLTFAAGAFFRFTAADADRIMGFGYERAVEALAGWDWLLPPSASNA
jgi:NTE family protein